jgi:hypothetical protein
VVLNELNVIKLSFINRFFGEEQPRRQQTSEIVNTWFTSMDGMSSISKLNYGLLMCLVEIMPNNSLNLWQIICLLMAENSN